MTEISFRAAALLSLRLSRELTQSELATLSRTSQAVISKAEQGHFPDEPNWSTRIAKALYVPVSAIETGSINPEELRCFYRSRRGAGRTAVTAARAELRVVFDRLANSIGAAKADLPILGSGDSVSASALASSVRRELLGSLGPIESLTQLLEGLGVWILRWPLDPADFDATGLRTSDGATLYLVGDHLPPERYRFTLAHLVWSSINREFAGDGWDSEASAFAAAFLLPPEELSLEWPEVPSLQALMPIKRRWGVSLAALIRHGKNHGLLTVPDYEALRIELVANGYQRREPDPVSVENPALISRQISERLSQGRTISDLADASRTFTDEFRNAFYRGIT